MCAPRAVIRIDRDEPPFIDTHRCHGCLVCIPECTAAVENGASAIREA
ncbi:MAG: hypothetical protein GY803_32515 [Chloroflexi bacterium]|nr:hypothetical protein [Chloroflexota bacterium]